MDSQELQPGKEVSSIYGVEKGVPLSGLRQSQAISNLKKSKFQNPNIK